MKKDNYNALIIGAGKIGAIYDQPNSKEILTHAKAYTQSNKVSEIAFVDTDKVALEKACKRWNCRGFSTIEEAVQNINPDIISICVPSELHYELLIQVCKFQPKLVCCEKPITLNPKQSKEVCDLYEKNNTLLSINYTRRFDTYVQTLKEQILQGVYGEVLNSSIIYTKGILNNGSHVLNLIEYLFGTVKSFKVLREIEDYQNQYEDKTIDAWLETDKCSSIHLLGANEKNYSIIEMDILFEKSRINFNQFGLKVTQQSVRKDPVFEGYSDLGDKQTEETQLHLAIQKYIDNGIDALSEGIPLISSGRSALKSEEVCYNILAKSKEALYAKTSY